MELIIQKDFRTSKYKTMIHESVNNNSEKYPFDYQEFRKSFMERYNAVKNENNIIKRDILINEIDIKIEQENKPKRKKLKKAAK